MEEKELELFSQVLEMFLRNGIKSMTMDDISRNLGISKKTLYKYVTDKNDLVIKAMELAAQEDQNMVTDVRKNCINAIDENFMIYQYVSKKLNNIHPSIFYDLQKYYPEAWKVLMDNKQNFIANCVEENLIRGIEEDLYRDDLNVKVTRDLYLAHMDFMFESKYPSLKEYTFSEIYLESFRYHIRGIASANGITYLIEKIKKEKSNN